MLTTPFLQEDLNRWNYNVKDVCYTLRIQQEQDKILRTLPAKTQEFHAWQQEKVIPALLQVMNRGVRIDLEKKELLRKQLLWLLGESKEEGFVDHNPNSVKKKLDWLIGESFNPKSRPQMLAVLQDLLGMELELNKKTRSPSTSSAHMLQYLKQYPQYRPLLSLILEYRSIGVFLRTFVEAKVDEDGRMRTNYNAAGTKTYRLSSRKNPFGSGANMANIPSKGKIKLKFALADLEDNEFSETDLDETGAESSLLEDEELEGLTELPNCKEMFIPDDGFVFWNADLSSADAMIVAADAECKWLLDFFKNPTMKLYQYIASHYYQREVSTDEPAYKAFKQFVHGSHYGMKEEKAALNAGISKKAAKEIREWYFGLCPEIPAWHDRIERQVATRHYVENIFGARGWFLEKDSPTLLNQAIAWIPQCVPLNHEVLTLVGWKEISEILPTEAIAVWHPNRNITFEVPVKWNFGETNSLVEFPELGYSCTPNHRLPYYNCGRPTLQVCEAVDKPKMARIPRNGFYSGQVVKSKAELTLMVALQADGTYDKKRDAFSFELKKPRKITRLEAALETLKIPFSKNERSDRKDTYVFYIAQASNWIDPKCKYFGPWLLELSGENLDYILSELEHWDGWRSKENQIWYTSSVKENCIWVSTIASLRGMKTSWLSEDSRATNTNYRITINPNLERGACSTTTKRVHKELKVKVGCPTVSTGFFLLRHNNKISITGNSTIAILINKGLVNLWEKEKEIHVLMQVHDALAGQFRETDLTAKERILNNMIVPIDYNGEELVIPVDFSSSPLSYGHCR